jgi:hypothetical protein
MQLDSATAYREADQYDIRSALAVAVFVAAFSLLDQALGGVIVTPYLPIVFGCGALRDLGRLIDRWRVAGGALGIVGDPSEIKDDHSIACWPTRFRLGWDAVCLGLAVTIIAPMLLSVKWPFENLRVLSIPVSYLVLLALCSWVLICGLLRLRFYGARARPALTLDKRGFQSTDGKRIGWEQVINCRLVQSQGEIDLLIDLRQPGPKGASWRRAAGWLNPWALEPNQIMLRISGYDVSARAICRIFERNCSTESATLPASDAPRVPPLMPSEVMPQLAEPAGAWLKPAH